MPAIAASASTSRPDDSAERWRPAALHDADPEQHHARRDGGGRQGDRERQQQERQDRHGRAETERRAHEQGATEHAAASVVDLDAELTGDHRPQQHLGVTGHQRRDPSGVLVAQPLLGQHVGDLGLCLARPLLDLVSLVVDLRIEDLALALAADVLAGGHREHPRQGAGDAGDDDRVGLARGAGHGRHDRERRYQPVLGAEDDLADLAQERARAALLGEVGGDPGAVVGRCRGIHRRSSGVQVAGRADHVGRVCHVRVRVAHRRRRRPPGYRRR